MRKFALGVSVCVAVLIGFAPSAFSAPSEKPAASSSQKKKTPQHATAKRQSSVKKSAKRLDQKSAKRVDKTFAKRGGRVIQTRLSARSSITSVKSKAGYQGVAYTPRARAVAPVLSAGDLAGLSATPDPLSLQSNAALVIDQATGQVLFAKNGDVALPIASLTKVMTALLVIEARQDLDEVLEVTSDDIDREKNSGSRLRVGARMSRGDMLHIALMSSENRAASALGRNYPGGLSAFVAAMNAKALALGMFNTRFADPTGLSSQNVSSAHDLAKLAQAAYAHPLIRVYSINPSYTVHAGSYALRYNNSNRLVAQPEWDIGLQKTGYIAEAGRCLLMQASIDGVAVIMVFLDSKGKYSRLADAARVRKWLEESRPAAVLQASLPQG